MKRLALLLLLLSTLAACGKYGALDDNPKKDPTYPRTYPQPY